METVQNSKVNNQLKKCLTKNTRHNEEIQLQVQNTQPKYE